MKSREWLVLFIQLFTLILVAPAQAGSKWVHTRGSFESLGGSQWVERARTSGDDVEFHFEETRRQDGFIEMYDASRDCYVRIYDTHLDYRCPREGRHDYVVCYHGSWEVGNLHILFVIDSDTNIGKAMVKNLEILQQVFREAIEANREKFEGRISMKILSGKEVTPENIRAQYAAGAPHADATGHLFYYTGHGAFDREKGRWLATSGGGITLNEVRNLINATGARSIVMLADCCGDIVEFQPPQRRTPAKWKVFNKLLFENTGIVEIHGSTEGESSWCNDEQGSMFTRCLCKLFCEPASGIREDGTDGEVTWEDFFERTRRETSELFASNRKLVEEYYKIHPDKFESRPKVLDASSQTPFAKHLGSWGGQLTRRLVLQNRTQERICVWLNFYDRDFESEKWQWYTSNGRPFVYELEPGQNATPRMNGFAIEARAVQIWARSLGASGKRWGNSTDVMMVTEGPYVGPLETKGFTFSP